MACQCPVCGRAVGWARRAAGSLILGRWTCGGCGARLQWQSRWLLLALLVAFVLFGLGLPWITGHHWAALVLAAVGYTGLLLENQTDLVYERGRCLRCGYDAAGRGGQCPECGWGPL